MAYLVPYARGRSYLSGIPRVTKPFRSLSCSFPLPRMCHILFLQILSIFQQPSLIPLALWSLFKLRPSPTAYAILPSILEKRRLSSTTYNLVLTIRFIFRLLSTCFMCIYLAWYFPLHNLNTVHMVDEVEADEFIDEWWSWWGISRVCSIFFFALISLLDDWMGIHSHE